MRYTYYKDYVGTLKYSEEDSVFHGKLLGIKDLVSYEGESITKLIANFHEAVDEYLDFCNRNGRPPDEPFSIREALNPNKRYTIKIISDELCGGYVVTHPALKGCITSGESVTEALLNLKDAKIEWMAAALELGVPIPKADILREQKVYFGRSKIIKLK